MKPETSLFPVTASKKMKKMIAAQWPIETIELV